MREIDQERVQAQGSRYHQQFHQGKEVDSSYDSGTQRRVVERTGETAFQSQETAYNDDTANSRNRKDGREDRQYSVPSVRNNQMDNQGTSTLSQQSIFSTEHQKTDNQLEQKGLQNRTHTSIKKSQEETSVCFSEEWTASALHASESG